MRAPPCSDRAPATLAVLHTLFLRMLRQESFPRAADGGLGRRIRQREVEKRIRGSQAPPTPSEIAARAVRPSPPETAAAVRP